MLESADTFKHIETQKSSVNLSLQKGMSENNSQKFPSSFEMRLSAKGKKVSPNSNRFSKTIQFACIASKDKLISSQLEKKNLNTKIDRS